MLFGEKSNTQHEKQSNEMQNFEIFWGDFFSNGNMKIENDDLPVL